MRRRAPLGRRSSSRPPSRAGRSGSPIDGAADGPVAVSPDLASRPRRSPSPRTSSAALAPAALARRRGRRRGPSLWVRRAEAVPPGADAVAGGCLFREAIVDLDARRRPPAPGDSASRFLRPTASSAPPSTTTATGRWRSSTAERSDLRLTLAADSGEAAAAARLSERRRASGWSGTSASRPGVGADSAARSALRESPSGFVPDWGDDGRLGLPAAVRAFTPS